MNCPIYCRTWSSIIPYYSLSQLQITLTSDHSGSLTVLSAGRLQVLHALQYMGSTFEDSESYSAVSAQNQNTTLESEPLQNNFSLITLATMLLWSSTCPSTKKVITWYHPKWCGMEMDGKRGGEMDGEIETKWKKWKSSVNWFTG